MKHFMNALLLSAAQDEDLIYLLLFAFKAQKIQVCRSRSEQLDLQQPFIQDINTGG